MKYRRLKICKYSFEVTKVIIISLATGLSFLKYICNIINDTSTYYRFNKK